MDFDDPRQLWAWGLALGGAFATWTAGRSPAAGWTMGLCMQAVWLAYAITSRQWGFVVSVGLYGYAYASNLRKALSE